MSRRVDYLNYIANGGNVNDLPLPMAPEDYPLYKIATSGVGGTGALKNSGGRVNGYYRCLLNSEASAHNFCSTILDLGETNRVTSAKAKFRFVVKSNTGVPTPLALGIRLFANNSPSRKDVSGYTIQNDTIITGATSIVAGNEYTIEGTFTETQGNNRLDTCRYLKPFLTLSKNAVDSGNTSEKHLIEVYEATIEVDGIIYDITDTISDFSPRIGSDITYIDGTFSNQVITMRNSKWFGKKVGCIGDSITYGMQPSQLDGTKQVSNPWVAQLKDYCGFADIKNYGLSGNRISGGANPMNTRYTGMVGNEDIVIVMGGTNDLSNNVPLGDFDETGAIATTNTFYGALNVLFKGLKNKYQNKTIVVMTPLNAVNQNIPGGVSTSGLTMEDYRVAIRNVAKLYNFPIIELQNLVGFDSMNDSDKTQYIPDGVHPNQAGHDMMARVISKFINSLA